MLDVKHLAWLAEIIELGSMSQAAEKLNVTQPTLSRAVQILESQAGAKLLLSTSRQLEKRIARCATPSKPKSDRRCWLGRLRCAELGNFCLLHGPLP